MKKLFSVTLFLFIFFSYVEATSFSLVKTIALGLNHAIEIDVVEDQLYVADYSDDLYHRFDAASGSQLGTFSLGNGYGIDNHGSEYNPTTGRLLHVLDDDGTGASYDSYLQTDLSGNIVFGPFDLFGAGKNSEDPESITVDPLTGRMWVGLNANSQPYAYGDIYEIDPTNGTIINTLSVGNNYAISFNPNSRTLFFADGSGVIKEINTDGSNLHTVFNPGHGRLYGMGFTPSGDLAISSLTTAYLYDSDLDGDALFSTGPVPEPSSICLLLMGCAYFLFRKYHEISE